MPTPVTNFAKGTVNQGYDASATSIALATGHGSRFPSTFPYPVTWWNATDYADPCDDPNREIVTVTAKTGDTLTVTRGAESSTASTKNTAAKTYRMIEGITKGMWDEVSRRQSAFQGLKVFTHPDADLYHKQVMFSADSITLDDGSLVGPWDDIVADITASGAGGLDTGAEGSNAWYDLYAIYNVASGLKKGLLHKAKTFAADTLYNTGLDGAHTLRRVTGNVTKLAQGFQLAVSGAIEIVDVTVFKSASPTGNFWFTIESNSGGVPSGVVLATSDKYDVARLPTSSTPNRTRIIFRTPFVGSASTQYHLVLQGDFTQSDTNYMNWRADTTAASYANGAKAAFAGSWVQDTDDDFNFWIYVTTNDIPVTMPSGYTGKALIGMVRNDSGGNFARFAQVQNIVTCGFDAAWAAAFSNTTADLVDVFDAIPPRPVSVQWMLQNASAAIVRLGDLHSTDLSSSATVAQANTAIGGVVAGGVGLTGEIYIEYRSAMVIVSAGTMNMYVSRFMW